MDHPISTNRSSGLIYWLFPVIGGISQAVYNTYFKILPAYIAISDGLIFGAVIGILGVAVWYVVRYNDPEKSSAGQMVASHIAAALVFTALWILLSGILVKSIINEPVYNSYLYSQLSARILSGLLMYALLGGIYYIYVYREHNREKARSEAAWQHQLREAQLNALKSQINPHFLFNSLNSIASLTLTNPAKAHGMVIALSDFMRYSLRKQQEDMVTLDIELKNIGLYMQIEKIRFGDNLKYSFNVNEECSNHLIPNLLLQPIFENAIKYGVYEASDPVEILLEARKIPGYMEIQIINDFDPASVPLKGEGVGLNNINERLRIIYGSSRLLTAEQGDNQFKVTLEIPDGF